MKMNIASEVFGSASVSASGDCRKNPLERRAVTIPTTETDWPTYADGADVPWTEWMATTGGGGGLTVNAMDAVPVRI